MHSRNPLSFPSQKVELLEGLGAGEAYRLMVAELGKFRLAVEQWTEARDTLLVRLSYLFSTLLV